MSDNDTIQADPYQLRKTDDIGLASNWLWSTLNHELKNSVGSTAAFIVIGGANMSIAFTLFDTVDHVLWGFDYFFFQVTNIVSFLLTPNISKENQDLIE